MAYQLFDSSVLKKREDGEVVLSNYLEDGETLMPSYATAADWDSAPAVVNQ